VQPGSPIWFETKSNLSLLSGLNSPMNNWSKLTLNFFMGTRVHSLKRNANKYVFAVMDWQV
jgi:hypothetical protein